MSLLLQSSASPLSAASSRPPRLSLARELLPEFILCGRPPRSQLVAGGRIGALLLALCFVLSYTPGVKALQNRALLSNEFDQRVKYNELQRLLEVGR